MLCIFRSFLIVFLVTAFCGCDRIYALLQKEGAEERELIGEIVPLESNPKVAQVQKLLRLYGYRVANPDGVMGPNTRSAISKFQEDSGLEVTRFIDKATWAELNKFEPCGLVVVGDLNVAAVQVALNAAGLSVGKADGIMGKKTLEAVKKFQKSHKLKADGKIGYKTLSALSRYLDCGAAPEE